jgi:hypothetical protein
MKLMKMNDEKIKKLWKWFFSNEHQIRDCIVTESASERAYIIEHLDNLVLDLGVFTWEIGSGINKPWSFTISPNGDKDRMKMSKRIIDNAPDLVDWEFNYSKPAKDWDRKVIVFDGFMTRQTIDASDWKYVALQHEDGMVALILEAKNIGHLDSDTASTAANLVILNEIGEETKIQSICSVDTVHQLEDKYDSRKDDIKNLKKHMNEFRTLPDKK